MIQTLRRFSPLLLVGLGFACATVTGDDEPLGTGGATGSGGDSATGGSSTTGGSSATGGLSATGGSAATGGASLGGAPATGGDAATGGTGGLPLTGDCANYPATSEVSTTGDRGVFTCSSNRDSCSGAELDVPSAFECVSSHGPNCKSQAPDMSGGTWQLVASCSELGMGGAGGEAP